MTRAAPPHPHTRFYAAVARSRQADGLAHALKLTESFYNRKNVGKKEKHDLKKKLLIKYEQLNIRSLFLFDFKQPEFGFWT